MAIDGIAFVEVVYALYKRQLESQFLTLESFEDAVGSDEDVDEARKEVVEALSGFFPLPRIVYIKMKETLPTDQKQEEEKDQDSPSGTN